MCAFWGQDFRHLVVFTTDNGAEAISFPDGGVTPFKGQKGEAWEGGYRVPHVVRWPGVIKPGTVHSQLFAALDWVPTLVDVAGSPKGNGLKEQIEEGRYPGIVKTTLDGVNQRDFLEGKSEKAARDYFYYFSGATWQCRCPRASGTHGGSAYGAGAMSLRRSPPFDDAGREKRPPQKARPRFPSAC